MRYLVLLISLGLLLALGGLAWGQQPGLTHGPISGEVSADAVTLWARAAEAGTMTFEIADSDAFRAEVQVDASTDFTGEVRLEGLSPATDYTYRVSFGGDTRTGRFRTAPASGSAAPLNFVFGSCIGGQGYCRPPETGWVIFDTMLAEAPDFFLLTGDTIYSGSGCPTDQNQNVPGAETPVSDLAGYYSRYRYHLEDEPYSRFLAQTPVYVTWDDHEIRDNFGGIELQRINPRMFQEGRQAFFDYWPISGTPDDPHRIYRQVGYGANADFFLLDTRSYRDPLVNWDPSPVDGVHKTMLGAEQFAWLQAGLLNSEATWKFIVSSVPLAYPTGFPQPQVEGRDGWANGGDRSGYETELMRLLFFIEAHDIGNVIFLTGDAHWPFAVSFDPDMDGEPNFYELSTSPLSAIPLAPGEPDQTFNPTVLYAEGEFRGSLFPFGQVSIAADGALTFRVMNQDGDERYRLDLQPAR